MNSIYVDEENLEKSRANIVYKNVYYKLTFLFLINEFEAFNKFNNVSLPFVGYFTTY
jgi:hypothetical protein